ncbi:MAG: adenylyltransferase [Candidatus Wallbacteria bacterium HGW-Wallbacteria-1]|uniref:Adenylyltransferase n=1 Tax=Candidatus Wallbacteria bacterium HGW-Wallbacteria-1 TaxID=2013854 RepID=A0A2N1PLA8_9BACT|nr:MAG: adenylyltransferase [Candidatus Wallbacteria bacterium HGW-Wallbacteria-1]
MKTSFSDSKGTASSPAGNLASTPAAALKQAIVLVIGLGGLGSAAALCLARAGVGTLGLVDPDRVEASNLNRQLLHLPSSIGHLKTDSAIASLRAVCPDIELKVHSFALDSTTAPEILHHNYDFIIEATDSGETKMLCNRICLERNLPFCIAGVSGHAGQLTTVIPGKTACYECIYPGDRASDDTADTDAVSNEAFNELLSPLVTVMGSLQAAEAIKFLSGNPSHLCVNQVLRLNMGANSFRNIRTVRRDHCAACGIGRD